MLRQFLVTFAFELVAVAPSVWLADTWGRAALEHGAEFGVYVVLLPLVTGAGVIALEPLKLAVERLVLARLPGLTSAPRPPC
ncbi:hypothetical protein [Aromatoleum anaerobium]|uniref:Uncharacterized protein n=1 Tax=Aromatoleum anaerobium TaxID=182180 RepID=A0ABX1PU75_9RHOO|nr:hypothetical protein [Aromatoleum anaerobium]MCK0507361.1 hypothetical protein [Aromatoleum anaerobium]